MRALLKSLLLPKDPLSAERASFVRKTVSLLLEGYTIYGRALLFCLITALLSIMLMPTDSFSTKKLNEELSAK